MDGPINTFSDRPSVRRKPATCRPREPRIIRKHLQQKYLLCGFVIHAFLATPVYLYGIIFDSTTDPILRIYAPVIYQAVDQLCKSYLQHSTDRLHTKKINHQNESRRIILFATLITCTGITACGYLFSSAWNSSTELVAIIIYGLFGGLGTSLIFARVHLILELVRPKEDKYVRKTIHLCGEAFCQLFLSFVITSLGTLYGAGDALILMGSILLNIIPLSLLISKKQIETNLKPKLLLESRYSSLPGFSILSQQPSPNQIDGIELQPQQKCWRSPNEVHYNYIAVAPEEAFVTYINPNGVEIMEIIPEEDEISSGLRSSNSINIDTNSISSSEYHYNITINPKAKPLDKVQKFYHHISDNLLDKIMVEIINPLRRAIVIPVLYPATLLQSCDIFSYVMCLTVLPDLAIDQHKLKFAEIPFLFSLLAFPWMCFALMTPRFGNTLVKKKIKWHIFGSSSKALGLLMISLSSTKLLLSLATVFLGFGQAVTLFLQDLVIKNGFSNSKWNDVRFPMHSTNGLLIIGMGFATRFYAAGGEFQETVGFVACLYFFSVVVWYITMIVRFILKL